MSHHKLCRPNPEWCTIIPYEDDEHNLRITPVEGRLFNPPKSRAFIGRNAVGAVQAMRAIWLLEGAGDPCRSDSAQRQRQVPGVSHLGKNRPRQTDTPRIN